MEKATGVVSLTWEQVQAHWMGRQFLGERTPKGIEDVVSSLCGIQTQVLSTLGLALWARAKGVTQEKVEAALYKRKSLVKTWAMRGTLYTLASRDLPMMVSVQKAHPRHHAWYKARHQKEVMAAIRSALSGKSLTRHELALEIMKMTGKGHLYEDLHSGWGSMLHPAAYNGILCFGRPRGQNVTFVDPEHWIGEASQKEMDKDQAARELIRRYLAAFGPSTGKRFATWFGRGIANGKDVFSLIGDEVQSVSVEGKKMFALSSDVKRMEKAQALSGVKLLPAFDVYTLSFPQEFREQVLGKYRKRIFREAGWIYPLVVVEGQVGGVWAYKRGLRNVEVKVSMFKPTDAGVKALIREEVSGLGEFMGAEARLSYSRV